MTNIVRLPVVLSKIGISRSTLYARIASGNFPRPVSLGGRAVGWLEEELQHWIEKQVQLSRTPSESSSVEDITTSRRLAVDFPKRAGLGRRL